MPRTVLIVEDVETCAAALEMALSGMDVDLITVASGEQAWRVVEDGLERVGAIITDLEMRGMDGFELIERVRARERVHLPDALPDDLPSRLAKRGGVPIVVITGSSDPEAPARAERLGANAFFPKPYSPGRVREKLEQLLKNHDSTKP